MKKLQFKKSDKTISAYISGGDEEDPENYIFLSAFSRALKIQIPKIFKDEHEYGFRLSAMDGSYDFLNIYYGIQSWDGNKTKRWGYFLPWTQWTHIRHSIYTPDGTHFATEEKGKWQEFSKICEECPKVSFEFLDYDGEKITATCMIEEREWSRGEKWCSWLKYFVPNMVRRSLDIQFSAEVGPEKGSWKGGTLGHGIDMLGGETPEEAFRRYCEQEHRSKYKNFKITFVK